MEWNTTRRARMCRNAGLGLIAICALALPARARDEAFDAEHALATAALLGDLEQLARWCDASELFLERDRLLRGILTLDPHNEYARRGLRYGRAADGTWVEPEPREVKNRNPKALAELAARRSAAAAPFRERVLELADRANLSRSERRTLQREILLVDPDDAWVRALQGEKKVGDAWVLMETWLARMRRPEIRAVAAAALASVPPLGTLAPNAHEAALGIPFRSGFVTPAVRVLSTGAEPEARRVTELCHATGAFFRSMFAVDTEHTPGYSVYLLAGEGEKAVFIQELRGLDASFKKFLDQVVGASIPGQAKVVYWDPSVERRIDGAVRQTLGDFLRRSFGIDFDDGWAWEGFGLYLTRELAGTRLTWFIRFDGTGQFNTLRARLMQPETNWMNEARVLLESPGHPRFEALIENDLNAMGVEDMLYAYALAAYMIESRPAQTPELLRRIGAGREPTAVVLQELLALDLADLEERLLRWLCERR